MPLRMRCDQDLPAAMRGVWTGGGMDQTHHTREIAVCCIVEQWTNPAVAKRDNARWVQRRVDESTELASRRAGHQTRAHEVYAMARFSLPGDATTSDDSAAGA
jgi:hypothetical protein